MEGSPAGGSPTSFGLLDSAAGFHHAATFVGVWTLVLLVAPKVLTEMRPILEPLLWAFFLMMGLLPITDIFERLLLKVWGLATRAGCRRARRDATDSGEEMSLRSDARERPISEEDSFSEGSADTDGDAKVGCGPSWAGRAEDDLDDDGSPQCQCARTTAVIIVVFCFFAFLLTFAYMVYKSAWHMNQEWQHYQEGADRLTERIKEIHDWLEDKMGNQVPRHFMNNAADKALAFMEEAVQTGLGEVMTNTSSIMFEGLMMMLYMMFWLCEPLHVADRVSNLFRRYILLKGLASFMYAFCVWVLLQCMSVDLAPFFGAVTFCFNWIPEVGPLFAMLLPCPVILFDGRQDRPIYKMMVALGGQLGLKFFFGNVVEVKLVERQQDMHMHPVIILYSVAFFGWIWGATGMLLSVPIVAAIKATVTVVPQAYRDPILIVLEGDKRAPERWRRRRERELKQMREESSSAQPGVTRANTHHWWHGANVH